MVNWPNSVFLVGTLILTLTAVPAFIWYHGVDRFQVLLFGAFFVTTGLSITVGYHRLFSHLTFKGRWPMRLWVLIFGAAAFENSALLWAADHRKHHKFVDHDEDPYNISKGFFHAHIGWMLSNGPVTTLEGVKDLLHDPLIRWQHRYYLPIAISSCFLLPALLGLVWDGWKGALGGFLLAGVARVVLVNHLTFFVNSCSHTWGKRPYSSRFSARDSAFLAWLTFGEGYHNFHHAFQHDYRNGVKVWQFDPTKWCIWFLHKLGLATQLRRVPKETILVAEITEKQQQLSAKLKSVSPPIRASIEQMLQTAQERLQHAFVNWELRKSEYGRAIQMKLELSQQKLAELQQEYRAAAARLRAAIRLWWETRRQAEAQIA